ncbi:unnamed protein product, partial [Ectocarpus fasciculatus]
MQLHTMFRHRSVNLGDHYQFHRVPSLHLFADVFTSFITRPFLKPLQHAPLPSKSSFLPKPSPPSFADVGHPPHGPILNSSIYIARARSGFFQTWFCSREVLGQARYSLSPQARHYLNRGRTTNRLDPSTFFGVAQNRVFAQPTNTARP